MTSHHYITMTSSLQVARQTHTKRERELVEKNSDLSFRLQAADRGRLAVEQTSRELVSRGGGFIAGGPLYHVCLFPSLLHV